MAHATWKLNGIWIVINPGESVSCLLFCVVVVVIVLSVICWLYGVAFTIHVTAANSLCIHCGKT